MGMGMVELLMAKKVTEIQRRQERRSLNQIQWLPLRSPEMQRSKRWTAKRPFVEPTEGENGPSDGPSDGVQRDEW